jgi:hypothetical protein
MLQGPHISYHNNIHGLLFASWMIEASISMQQTLPITPNNINMISCLCPHIIHRNILSLVKSWNSAGNPHGGAARSDVGPRVTHVLGIVVVNLRGASGKTVYRVLLLVLDVGPWVRHFIGCCCWFMWGLGQHTLLGIVVGYVAPLATHVTGYCFGVRGASDNTLYWVLLWVMRGFGQHTLLVIIRSDVGRLHQWVQNNPFS